MSTEHPAVHPDADMKETTRVETDLGAVDGGEVGARPRGWRHHQIKAGPVNLAWYASPPFQLVLVSFVCFLCPGMFNALSGLGGGGQTDPTLADKMNIGLYSTFAVFAFFGGGFVNYCGVRLTLALGGIGYCIYALSLLLSVHYSVGGFNITAGVLLGFCAGLLWTAQGTIMISYPAEKDKGKYFGIFWAIFNLGAVIGSLIPLGESIHSKENKTVSDGTYIAFIVLMFFGSLLALLACNGRDVIRKDGSRVVLMKHPTVVSEIIGMWETFTYQPMVVLLFPMFWSSNWFITYQANSVNGAYFTTRTKALNNLLYYLAQIVGALAFGYAMDIQYFKRSLRAKISLVFLFALTMIVWGGGYAFAKGYTRADVNKDLHPDHQFMDWSTSGYVGPMFLYIFYGLYDAVWQASVYWYMGALSNSGRRSANYVGFYKGIQSAGAAVMWSLDSHKMPYLSEFASNWGLLGGSLIVAAPIIWLKISDHVSVEDDLHNTDETLADVLPQGHPEKTVV
ncbi:putative UNC93-like protein [Amylocarpus encephaloides]|uniref:UNC93-like protein n=1 Tax=Amylocarpus encephaloides TaxID=45428 RepID=A0A9P7YKZ5_9HELO|nr:putative UNC93-like protein [Amylocarpus encephaloides]